MLTNNHFLGKAVVNPFEMASLLSDRPVEVTEQLMQHYPVLDQVSAEKRPRRHHSEGLTSCWSCPDFTRDGRNSVIRALKPS